MDLMSIRCRWGCQSRAGEVDPRPHSLAPANEHGGMTSQRPSIARDGGDDRLERFRWTPIICRAASEQSPWCDATGRGGRIEGLSDAADEGRVASHHEQNAGTSSRQLNNIRKFRPRLDDNFLCRIQFHPPHRHSHPCPIPPSATLRLQSTVLQQPNSNIPLHPRRQMHLDIQIQINRNLQTTRLALVLLDLLVFIVVVIVVCGRGGRRVLRALAPRLEALSRFVGGGEGVVAFGYALGCFAEGKGLAWVVMGVRGEVRGLVEGVA